MSEEEVKQGTPEYEECMKFKNLVTASIKEGGNTVTTYKPLTVEKQGPGAVYVIQFGKPTEVATVTIGPKTDDTEPETCVGDRAMYSCGC